MADALNAVPWEMLLSAVAFSCLITVVKRCFRLIWNKYYPVVEDEAVEKEEEQTEAVDGAPASKASTNNKKKKAKPKVEAPAAAEASRGRKPTQIEVWALPIFTFSMMFYFVGGAYVKYGPLFFYSPHNKVLNLEASEWQAKLENRTVAFVGGHHKGGTTVLWRSIAHHKDVAWFGEQRASGLDFSEGVFAQGVYPTFGIGNEFALNLKILWGKHVTGKAVPFSAQDGLGRYALGPVDDVYWTETHSSVTGEAQAQILNSFGFLWDRQAPGLDGASVYLEKSPQNAILARFLEAVVDFPHKVGGRTHCGKKDDFCAEAAGLRPVDSRAKFLFLMRDPIANAMSLAKQRSWGTRQRIYDLVAHWVAVSTYMQANAEKVQHAMIVKLEDLAKRPSETVLEAWGFLGLEGHTRLDADAATKHVKGDPNAKYKREYCAEIKKDSGKRREYELIVQSFARTIDKFGYDIRDWCGDAI